jgi:hypothetical protein
MRRLTSTIGAIASIATCLLIAAGPAWALWPGDGKVVTSLSGTGAKGVIDGAGGTIVAWEDRRSGIFDVYAQRLDADGNRVWWPEEGVPICTAVFDQFDIRIVPDGQGGAVIFWNDLRFGAAYLYAQRVDASGQVRWAPDGVPVAATNIGPGMYRICPDGTGGAFLVYEDDFLAGNLLDILGARIDGTGTLIWAATVCALSYDQIMPDLVEDGSGGAIITWMDLRNGIDFDIYAQRVNAVGAPQWSPNGNAVLINPASQDTPLLATDGQAGAIVVWVDWRNGDADLYGERITGAGAITWGSVPIAVDVNQQATHQVIYDGQGGVIVAWEDWRSGSDSDIYAERVDAYGISWWMGNGTPICTQPNNQYLSGICSDGLGGGIFSWSDERNIAPPELYTQRVDIYGGVLWNPDGEWVASPGFGFWEKRAVADGTGGAILLWDDGMTVTSAQHVDGRGRLGDPVPTIASVGDVPNDQGGWVSVDWSRSWADDGDLARVTHYTVWRALSETAAPAPGMEVLSAGEVTADYRGPAVRAVTLGTATSYWELVATVDAHRLADYSYTAATRFDSTSASGAMHHFLVSAHTADPLVYWDSAPDSGYSVDNLAPLAPAPVAGEYLYPPSQLRITWGPNAEADLVHYAVYKGSTPGFVPGPGNLIGSPTDTLLVDSSFDGNVSNYYKISAWDIHENESPFTLLSPEDVIGVGTTPPRQTAVLHQSFPNPFRATTTIGFSLAEPGRVVLRIYDLAGRPVRTLVDGDLTARYHAITWDGADGQGRPAPSGIYLYRLEKEGYRTARKLLLAR